MAYTVVGYAGGTQLTFGATTAAEALQRIDALRRSGLRFRLARDEAHVFSEDDIARLAAEEFRLARTRP